MQYAAVFLACYLMCATYSNKLNFSSVVLAAMLSSVLWAWQVTYSAWCHDKMLAILLWYQDWAVGLASTGLKEKERQRLLALIDWLIWTCASQGEKRVCITPTLQAIQQTCFHHPLSAFIKNSLRMRCIGLPCGAWQQACCARPVGVGLNTAVDDLRRKDKARLGCSVVIEEKPKVEVYWTSV